MALGLLGGYHASKVAGLHSLGDSLQGLSLVLILIERLYQDLQGKSTAVTKFVQARLDSLLKFYVGSIPRPQWGLWLEDTFVGRILVL